MVEGARRRSFEAGHRPKFLVVVDASPECDRAIHFAARRVARLGASMVLLAVAEPPDDFEWLGVSDALRAEAEEENAARLAEKAAVARGAGADPELVQRLGERGEVILTLIEEDQDISFLVLAASTAKEGPGPLVASLTGAAAGSFPVPVVIVPGGLTDAEIDALAG